MIQYKCPYCGEKKKLHFYYDWTKAERPIKEIECDACGVHFQPPQTIEEVIELKKETKQTLFTEEQVRKAIEDARDILSYVNTDEVIKSLKQQP